MKRFLLLITAVMLFVVASWAHDVVVDGIYYNLDETNNTAEVTYKGDSYNSYDEYSGSVVIPSSITYNSEIYSVTSIGEVAFYSCDALTSVNIGNNVTSISHNAFYNCLDLTSVLWNVKYYEDFSRGSSSPFYNSDITSFTIGNEVEYVPAYLCCDNNNLTSVTIGKNVRKIGDYAFKGCNNLKNITAYPKNVPYVYETSFAHYN